MNKVFARKRLATDRRSSQPTVFANPAFDNTAATLPSSSNGTRRSSENSVLTSTSIVEHSEAPVHGLPPLTEISSRPVQHHASENAQISSPPYIENVDASDFHKHFERLRVEALPKAVPETTIHGNAIINGHSETAISNPSHHGGIVTADAAKSGSPPRARTDTPSQNPQIASTAPTDINDGFAKYLYEKALAEVKIHNMSGAAPYIQRLKEINSHASRTLVGLLMDEESSHLYQEALEMAKRGNQQFVLDILEQISSGPSAASPEMTSKLREELGVYYYGLFQKNLQEEDTPISLYEKQIRHLATISTSYDSKDLELLLTNAMQARGLKFLRTDRPSQARALYMELYSRGNKVWWSIAVNLASFYQTRASYLISSTEGATPDEDQDLFILNSETVDDVAELFDTIDAILIHLSTMRPDNMLDATEILRHPFGKRDFSTHITLPESLRQSRGSLLLGIISRCQISVMCLWKRGQMEQAYELLQKYERFTDLTHQDDSTFQMQLAKYHFAIRLQDLGQTSDRLGSVRVVGEGEQYVDIDPRDDCERFIHYLTCAEVSFFHRRNLRYAHSFCEKALALSFDPSWPTFCVREDAIYLQARVLAQKKLPLDSDYYYSLIPPTYDQFRVYGMWGQVLRKHKVQISKGFLGIDDANLPNIISASISELKLKLSLGSTGSQPLTHALFMDDVSWQSRLTSQLPEYNIHPQAKPAILHIYAAFGDVQSLQIALGNPETNLDIRDKQGICVLHYAAFFGRPEATQVLLSRGIKVDEPDSNRNTALHWLFGGVRNTLKGEGSHENIMATLNILLAAGAHKTFKNSDRWTPLHVLVEVMKEDCITWNYENDKQKANLEKKLRHIMSYFDALGVTLSTGGPLLDGSAEPLAGTDRGLYMQARRLLREISENQPLQPAAMEEVSQPSGITPRGVEAAETIGDVEKKKKKKSMMRKMMFL